MNYCVKTPFMVPCDFAQGWLTTNGGEITEFNYLSARPETCMMDVEAFLTFPTV
jgi:hypothetical protein